MKTLLLMKTLNKQLPCWCASIVHQHPNSSIVWTSGSVQSLEFFQVIFPVVSWLHSHISFFPHLIATVGHLLPSVEFIRVLRPLNIKVGTQTRPLSCGFDSLVGRALHGNANAVGSNPVQSLNFFFRSFFQVIYPEVLWPHLHISFFHLELTLHI